jgi:hypothetical protein
MHWIITDTSLFFDDPSVALSVEVLGLLAFFALALEEFEMLGAFFT